MKFLILFMFFAVLIMSLAEGSRGYHVFDYDSCYEPAETGECKGYIPRIYFDRYTKTCKDFVYGGCGGNANNFLTIEECEAACKKRGGREPFESTRRPRIRGGAPFDDRHCTKPPHPGNCGAYGIRFFFDMRTKTCKTFEFGGCVVGDHNIFSTIEECEVLCEKWLRREHLKAPECLEAEVVGPCKGRFIKYRYDPPTNTCVTFTYGGCGGNGNNFNTLEDCEAGCKDDLM